MELILLARRKHKHRKIIHLCPQKIMRKIRLMHHLETVITELLYL